jgi:FkbM family methyltransferase
MLERLMTLVIRPVGLALVRRTGQFDVTWRRLKLLRKQGLAVHLAVDGGAASGTWAERFKRIFPQAKVLCIEPREDAQAALKALAARRSGVQVAQTLIGDTEGAVDFYEHRDQSSMLRDNGDKPWGVVRQAQLTTLDRLIGALKLPVPDLIKLDLQGAELIALRGATQCLAETQAIILEVSFIPLYHNAPSLAEVVAFMAERGFRLWDILSLWHRPLDGATAFGDFLFLRKDHSLLRDNRWSTSGKFERSLFR